MSAEQEVLPAELAAAIEDLRDQFERDLRDDRRPFTSNPDEFVRRVLDREVERLERLQPRSELPGADLLVLLCGTSAQPLLVSAVYLRPRHVCIVHTATPDGENTRADFERLLHDRAPAIRSFAHPIDGSDPVRAFVDLLAAVDSACAETGTPAERALLDITGGKKTMVAAAFLAASPM